MRVTLRGEFERAERWLQRAIAAEAKVERVASLADEWDRLAHDNREAARKHGDIERDWIASDYEIKGAALRAALDGTR